MLEPMSLTERWRRASRLLADHLDVLAERPDVAPPRWAIRRGWRDVLDGLDDAALDACERDGLAAHLDPLDAPPDLAAAVAEAAAVTALPRLVAGCAPERLRRVPARKRHQLAAIAALVADAAPGRVVDVGAGHGHLTRHLADALRVQGLGLERDPDRVATARSLAGAAAALEVGFEVVDVFAEAPPLHPRDLVVGLHACGALTDRLIIEAARAGAELLCVSCCLHKRPEEDRRPLAPDGPLADTPLPHAALGLGNLAHGAQGVEASLRDNVAARVRRSALRALLRARGITLAPGDEMRGVNRRRAHTPLAAFVAHVLTSRGLPPATDDELTAAEAIGRAEQGRARRWSIGRRWLGRVVEVQVACDRAMYLTRRGYRVELGTLWPTAISPRNIAILARR